MTPMTLTTVTLNPTTQTPVTLTLVTSMTLTPMTLTPMTLTPMTLTPVTLTPVTLTQVNLFGIAIFERGTGIKNVALCPRMSKFHAVVRHILPSSFGSQAKIQFVEACLPLFQLLELIQIHMLRTFHLFISPDIWWSLQQMILLFLLGLHQGGVGIKWTMPKRHC